MKPLACTVLFLVVGLVLFGAQAKSGKPAATAETSATISRQIDALLKRRLQPEPLPVDLPNPFMLGEIAVREGSAATIETSRAPDANRNLEREPPSSAEILASCAARLRVAGLIRMKDQLQVVINDTPRKEGDTITVHWEELPVQLRVVRLLSNQIVLRYKDAELTLKY